MRSIMRTLCKVLALFWFLSLLPTDANAEPTRSCSKVTGRCSVSIKSQGSPPRINRPSSEGPDGRRSADAARAKFDKEFAAYKAAVERFNTCRRAEVAGAGPTGLCGTSPLMADTTMAGNTAGGAGGAGGAPLITPGQAGALAAARLKIPTVAPGIGPPSDLNRWKMAAVGYPLWLWADGPTQIGPVSDSVAGLSVSLRAEVTSLTFRMGDGKVVTCQGTGDKWSKAVAPGTKAPSCGHTYIKPSLPKSNYTVAALTEWAVTWTANGQSGVINVPAVQTAELPVGELQVLVR